MPPIRGHQDHQWTRFELQTMLSLIARGVHLSASATRKDLPSQVQKNAYLNFATELNLALHGTDYEQDISKREVTKMLDRVLGEKKAVMCLIERQSTGRITRSLRMAWECNRKGDFDGSLSEWKMGRKVKEEDKRRAEMGLPPLDRVAATPAFAEVVQKVITVPSQPQTRIYKKPGRNASRFKSAHTVIESDDEGSDTESPRRVLGKENLRDVERLVTASAGYASPRPSKTRDLRTPLKRRDQEQIELETPGLVTDDSSPEKMVETPEAAAATTVYKLGEEGLTKVGGGDVEMAEDGEIAQELDEELFGF